MPRLLLAPRLSAPSSRSVLRCLSLVSALALVACDDVPLGSGHEGPTGPLPDAPTLCDVVEHVFAPSCVGCHGEGGTAPLLTEAGAAGLIEAESARYPGAVFVVPGDLEASLLYRKLSGTQGADEGAPMPMGGSLSEDKLALVASWIEGGAVTSCDAPQAPDGGGDPVDPGGPVDAGPLPDEVTLCDVESRLFAPRCTSCHGAGAQAPDLTLAGARASLVGVAGAGGATRVIAGDAEGSLLLRKLTGDLSPSEGAPMPYGGSASADEIELVRRWIDQGAEVDCEAQEPVEPPPPVVTCSSDRYWTEGDDGSPRMHPGRACITCHSAEAEDDDDVPDLIVGGTLYPTLHEPDDCMGANGTGAFAGAEVHITDAQGTLFRLPVNSSGNFLLHRRDAPSFDMPFTARIVFDGRERVMHTPQQTGNCNSCHTVDGRNGAPGRIRVP